VETVDASPALPRPPPLAAESSVPATAGSRSPSRRRAPATR